MVVLIFHVQTQLAFPIRAHVLRCNTVAAYVIREWRLAAVEDDSPACAENVQVLQRAIADFGSMRRQHTQGAILGGGTGTGVEAPLPRSPCTVQRAALPTHM
jgi:hypothetical protein